MLQRVFKNVPNGTYIDVGAAVPIPDSNTYALYQKGWRGVAMEPLMLYNEQWMLTRPGDKLINAAASDKVGDTTLYVYDEATQVSTCNVKTVEHWELNKIKHSRTIKVPTTTLDRVITDHLQGKPIHLISIDAEGFEPNVLAGLSLRIHRPWIMVVEATIPGTPLPNHHKWEPALLEAGYLMVYFDGINRFYLANEQRNLIGAFATPPNSWDNFETLIKPL